MNYYIIPKTNINIQFNIKEENGIITPYISNSIFYHINDMQCQIDNLKYNDDAELVDEICKIMHPYCFIYSNVPDSLLSVNKLDSNNPVIFELIEILHYFRLKDLFQTNIINYGIFSNNNLITDLFDLYKDVSLNAIVSSKLFDIQFNENIKLDLIICEMTENYCRSIILILLIILHCQTNNGMMIIKLGSIYEKIIVEFIFILSSFYNKVYLMKPNVSDINNGDKYLICINYTNNNNNIILINYLFNYVSLSFNSLIDNKIPLHFTNKLEEINAIIGNQQLDVYDQIINMYNNKNRDEKIENIKRLHIQKSVMWCDKYGVPCNKFSDKTNIFLMQKTIPNNVIDI
jgi:hypothetical protein